MTALLEKAFATSDTWDFSTANCALVDVRFDGKAYAMKQEADDALHISNDQMRAFAATRNPPQSWYDEDMTGMY